MFYYFTKIGKKLHRDTEYGSEVMMVKFLYGESVNILPRIEGIPEAYAGIIRQPEQVSKMEDNIGTETLSEQ